LLVVYVFLIAVSIYGATQVRIDFKVTYFIGDTSYVYNWFQKNEEYFAAG
jgi:predicted RND superfamily exporter protein